MLPGNMLLVSGNMSPVTWIVSVEKKLQNRVAYIDFSRAFDSVSHPKPVHKLKSYGIR